jgi:hypothetical protein
MSLPKCDAKTRRGDRHPCKLAAGHGTDHVGYGHCRYHTGSTRNGTVSAQRKRVEASVQAALGQAAVIDPADGALLAVHLAHGLTSFWREKVANEHPPTPATLQGYRQAVSDLSKLSGRAIDGRVLERQAAAVERMGEQIALVCEAGLAALIASGVQVERQHRTAYANAIAEALRQHEQPEVVEAEVVSLPG